MKQRILLPTLAMAAAIAVVSSVADCSEPARVILDTDMASDCDDAGAKTRRGKPSSYTAALRDEFPHDSKPDDQMPDALDVYRELLAAPPGAARSVTKQAAGQPHRALQGRRFSAI